MTEGLFKQLREFLQRYSGRIDEKHLIMGLFLKGIKAHIEHFGKHKE